MADAASEGEAAVAAAGPTTTRPAKVPAEVNDYTVLTMRMPAVPIKYCGADAGQETFPLHYSYIRAHIPRIAEPAQERSLFMANIPVDATEEHLREIFIDQLGGGRIESIDFEARHGSTARLGSANAAFLEASPDSILQANREKRRQAKKRKRSGSNNNNNNADTSSSTTAIQAEGDNNHDDHEDAEDDAMPRLTEILPAPWSRELVAPGGTAVVRFIDRPSMEAALKAAQRRATAATTVSWPPLLSARVPSLGSLRYADHKTRRFASMESMQTLVDNYMQTLDARDAAKMRADAQRRSVPDADGFVTVLRGGRVGAAKHDAARERLAAHEKKEASKRQRMSDFYRFQTRDEKKKRADLLIKKFDAKKRALQDKTTMREKGAGAPGSGSGSSA